jgi:lipopolysaccharide/colanic/teichoic acid biosynthesis glycosyltransferase
MLLFSPLYVLVYCAIKIERTGPALFRQERIGYRSKPFVLYKFRTMHVRAEADGTPQLYISKDKRLTRVGRFLREHHLGELPQLWNILKGDMSFVGPRPERKYFIDKIMLENPDYVYLYQLRPGVFSKATLYNGYTDTMEKMLVRLRMDLEYLTTRSIGMDVKIIFLTVMSIIIGKKF